MGLLGGWEWLGGWGGRLIDVRDLLGGCFGVLERVSSGFCKNLDLCEARTAYFLIQIAFHCLCCYSYHLKEFERHKAHGVSQAMIASTKVSSHGSQYFTSLA